MKTITIYSRPSCQPCKRIKKWWEQRGIAYQEVNVEESPDDLAAIKYLGYQSVPVTLVNYGDNETELHWQGFIPDNMTKYIAKKAA